MKTNLPLIGTTSPDETSSWLAVERINWFPESAPDARTPVILRTAAGLVTVESGMGGTHRGMRVMGGRLYCVTGESLWQLTGDFVRTKVGTVLGGERVTMTDNFEPESTRTLVLGTGERGYLYETGSGGFSEIVDAYFSSVANKITPITSGRYTLWPTDDGAIWSDLNDPTTYPSLNTRTAETVTDGVTGLALVNGDPWVLGSRSIEVWRLTGQANENAFTLVQTIDYGVAGPYCNTEGDNGFFFLDNEGRRVFRCQGFAAQRISTHQIEQWLSKLDPDDVADSWMFSFVDRGHEFIGLTVPGSQTQVYDVSTGVWSRRQSKGMTRWRTNTHAFFRGLNVFGDYDSGRLRKLDPTFIGEGNGAPFTVGEDEMPRVLITPYVHQDGERVRNIAVEVFAQFGEASQTGIVINTDPVIRLSYSEDGGHNYSTPMEHPVGRIGEYIQRMRWDRLGSTRQRTVKLEITDPVRVDIFGATIEGQV